MSSISLAPLLLFVSVATITPGAGNTLATTSGARFGFRRSIPLITGLAAGLGTLAAASAAGLAGLLLAAPFLQTGMKTLGSVYLIWLAWQIGRRGAPSQGSGSVGPTSVFGAACLLWINPKGWAMTLGAAASFAMLASGPAQLAVLLGATFAISATLSLCFWCVAGSLLSRKLRTDRHWRVFNMTMAVLLVVSVVPMWR